MKAININNPDVPIGAENIASRNLALWGGSGRLPVYENMVANIISGEIVVSSGIYSNQGYEIEIPEGETVTFPIITESSGIKRYDLVISQLTRDGDGVESHIISLVSGTAAISPTVPSLTVGDFKGGEDTRQEIIHTILIDGTTASVASSASVLSISGSAKQTLTVKGDATGSITFDGSSNKTLELKVNNTKNINNRAIYIQPEQPANPEAWDLWIW